MTLPVVQSTISALAERIRQDILDGVYAPGQLLTQRDAAARYGVSRIPLREALRQLEAERWVVYYQNRGAFVAAVTAADVRNLYGVRRILEMGSVAALVHNVDEPTLHEARSLDAEMRRAKELGAIVAAHNRFHELLYGSTRNPRLVEAIAGHRVTVRRLPDPQPRIAAIVKMTRAHHRALLRACAARDVKAAQRATDAELAELQEIMLAGLPEAGA
jgi:DNA-binding GntR family transcriptional regulator